MIQSETHQHNINETTIIKVRLGFLMMSCGSGLLNLSILLNDGVDLTQVGQLEGTVYATALTCFVLGLISVLNRSKRKANTTCQLYKTFLPVFWIGILSLFTLDLLEISAEAYLRYNQINQLYWYTINRRTESYNIILENPAYKDMPYATSAFIDEVIASQGITVNTSDHGYIVPNNFHGEWINVENHRRITTHQPADSQQAIYLFGGSTIFNLAVPDEYTVASILQGHLIKTYGHIFRVENLGVIGATTHQQWLRLQTMDLQEGDIVIFFDGYNDIFKGIRRENEPLLNVLSKSIFFNFFLKPAIHPWLPPFHPPDSAELEFNYYQNIRSACTFTQTEKGQFLHIIQPSLHTVANRSLYEEEIIQSLITQGRGWHESFLFGYPILIQVHEILIADGISSWDATSILDHEQRNFDHEIFLDDIHINHLGNEMIASAIFSIIQEKISVNESIDTPAPALGSN